LGDPRDPSASSEPDWIDEFKEKIDLVILITGDSSERIDDRAQGIEDIFGLNTAEASLRQVIALNGKVRPGEHKGHEQ